MKQITIEVDEKIESAFLNVNSAQKQELINLVTIYLENKWQEKNFIEVMSEISDLAQQRGLTPEILEDLLADEDE
jgi:hypothetical protein